MEFELIQKFLAIFVPLQMFNENIWYRGPVLVNQLPFLVKYMKTIVGNVI